MSKQKISLTVPPNYIAQVDEIAERRRRSRSFIIAEAIEKYLENGHIKPPPLATIKHYPATVKHSPHRSKKTGAR